MNLKHLGNQKLLSDTLDLSKQESKITAQLLWHIREIEDRKLYFECGYNSIFDYLVKGLKYAHGSAYRRLQAARLLRFVPEVAEKIESGSLNLTTAAFTQNLMMVHEKYEGRLSREQKAQIIEKIENKSSCTVEQVLAKELPQATLQLEQKKKESIKQLTENKTLLTLVVDRETAELLNRAEEILSNACSGKGEVLKRILHEFVARKDPLKQKSVAQSAAATAPAGRQNLKVSIKRIIFQRDQAKCQHRDPKTGNICGSRSYLNIDHIIPVAKGGSNHPDNLRVLCRAHNVLAAEVIFGRDHMARFKMAREE